MKIPKTKAPEPVPAGVFPARCYKIIYYGTIPTQYNGQQQMRPIIRIDFELPTKTKVFDEQKGPQPLSISKEYTATLNEKGNLYHDLVSWIGKRVNDDDFEINEILGKECYVNIQQKESKSTGNTYSFIASIMPVPEGATVPPQVNPSFMWDYEDNFDEGVLANLHEYFQGKIKSSEEYKAKMTPVDVQAAPMPTKDDDPGEPVQDDLPF